MASVTLPDVEFVGTAGCKATLYRCSATDLDVARSAWVSQDSRAHERESEPGRVSGLINFLWRNGHTSPFEHGQFTFIVEAPIFVAREFMRHRTFSYNEISGRYTKLPFKAYLPPYCRPIVQTGKIGEYTYSNGTFRQEMQVQDAIRHNTESAFDYYNNLIDSGVANEVARMVLPVNTMTTFWATCNPLNLIKFLKLRTSDDALYEIDLVASDMEKALRENMPLTYRAWRENP